MADKKKDIKQQNIIQLVLGLSIIVLLNVIGYYVFTRFDLTSEKRYTLSKPTKDILRNLDDVVYFEVYLDGDFPAGFKRLKRETKEMLDQFRAYSDNIQYEFINPSASSDPQERRDVYQRLTERGLNPTELQVQDKEGSSQQIIFPGAIVTYKAKEIPVELLLSQMGVPSEEVLNNSIQNLEFNLVNAVKKLTVGFRPKIAFIEGNGELSRLQTADIGNALSEYYSVDRVKIDGRLSSLTERSVTDSTTVNIRNKYDAIIIAKPDSAFSEKDKFIIDQYIMRGGKVLWCIDPVFASMDSLNKSATVGIINDINLEDQLFNYGIRLNTNLVMDLNALPIPVTTGEVGGAPQIDFFPWYYFPILTPYIDHPIVKNLNAVRTEFISSIDTIDVKGVKKTILLESSQYSRTVNTPVLISLDVLDKNPDERLYNQPNIPVAALLEGKFPSLYFNRIPPEIRDNKDIGFLPHSRETKMIVIADGDIIKNQFRNSGGRSIPYPLGYDRYTELTFGNKELILNAMNYLVDESGLISIRSRELKLRLLDKTKISENRFFWQLINLFIPIFIILTIGGWFNIIRMKTYTDFSSGNNFININGRVKRLTFFLQRFILNLFLTICGYLIYTYYYFAEPGLLLFLLSSILVIIVISMIILIIILNIRRLHDINSSGWFVLLLLVPIINVLFDLLILFIPGSKGQNKYGPDPRIKKFKKIK
ncbi:MAG: gliding motility-associated ABC transporter substrate-binding protein GldG [Bacteroidales bacterium]|nr:gliding motility-associated ABC transporter substrate-binding protein GldG [Bacteroidales bacterium]